MKRDEKRFVGEMFFLWKYKEKKVKKEEEKVEGEGRREKGEGRDRER